jgi:hypothetical protein
VLQVLYPQKCAALGRTHQIKPEDLAIEQRPAIDTQDREGAEE